jgi:choline dehydrogenase-like flavoprotein
VANVWGPGTRRDDHLIALQERPDGDVTLSIECLPDTEARAHLHQLAEKVRSALGRLGCVVPRGMTQVLPLGSSVHYAGTIPMSREEREHTSTPEGRLRGFTNVLVVDGATFPSLPAKNLTFTLMANAARVAAALDSAETV